MNRVLKRTFGLIRKEATLGWRKLHYDGLPNSYPSPEIICVMKSSRTDKQENLQHMGGTRNAYIILVLVPEGKRT
jgi:hypothetical protein